MSGVLHGHALPGSPTGGAQGIPHRRAEQPPRISGCSCSVSADRRLGARRFASQSARKTRPERRRHAAVSRTQNDDGSSSPRRIRPRPKRHVTSSLLVAAVSARRPWRPRPNLPPRWLGPRLLLCLPRDRDRGCDRRSPRRPVLTPSPRFDAVALRQLLRPVRRLPRLCEVLLTRRSGYRSRQREGLHAVLTTWPPGSAVRRDPDTYREFRRRSAESIKARNHGVEQLHL